jgi:hypothetical protein
MALFLTGSHTFKKPEMNMSDADQTIWTVGMSIAMVFPLVVRKESNRQLLG